MMDAERALHEISRAFRGSAFADRVLMALAKADAARELMETDKNAIKEATEFLEQVEQGYNWIEDPVISSNSLRCAVSFKTAIRSLERSVSSITFKNDVQAMLRTTKAVQEGEILDKNELKRTRDFFCRMLSTEINDFDEIFSVPAGRGGGWELVRHSLV